MRLMLLLHPLKIILVNLESLWARFLLPLFWLFFSRFGQIFTSHRVSTRGIGKVQKNKVQTKVEKSELKRKNAQKRQKS